MSKFKKDMKRYQNNVSKLAALKEVLGPLQQSGSVEANHKPHQLTGNYAGCMECYIQNDFLLVIQIAPEKQKNKDKAIPMKGAALSFFYSSPRWLVRRMM